MNDVLDSLSGLKERRLEEYHQLVDRVFGGEQIAASEIEMSCVLAGQDPGDFARIIRKRQERVKERERVGTLPEVQQQLVDLDAEIAANREKLEAARLAHDQEYRRLAPLRDAAINEIQSLHTLKQSITKGCGDESLVRRARTLGIYLEENRRKRSEAVRNLHTQQAILRQGADGTLERWWFDRNALTPPLPTEVANDAPFAELKRRVLRAQAVVDQLDDQAAEFQREIEENLVAQYEW